MKKLFTLIVCALFLGSHIFSSISLYPNYEFYRSPLFGGLEGVSCAFKYDGGGIAYKKSAEFLKMTNSIDSPIYVGGQAQILNYYLPEYTLLWGTGHHLAPGLDFIFYLLNNNVQYAMFGLEWIQYNSDHPSYNTFKDYVPDFVYSFDGAELVWIYKISQETLNDLTNNLKNPSFEENLDFWEIIIGHPSFVKNMSATGNQSLRAFSLTQENQRVIQNIQIPAEESVIMFAGWVKGEDVTGQGHPFIRVDITYTNGSEVGSEVRWRESEQNFSWTFKSKSIKIIDVKKIEKISIIVGTWAVSGEVWFDDISVFLHN